MVARSRLPFAAAALLLILHAVAYLHWTEDDAGITLRYVENLVQGRGLVYNEGERVEAISNLGLVLVLAPVYGAVAGPEDAPEGGRLRLLLAAKVLGIGAALLGLGEAARLARSCGLGPRAVASTRILVAGSAPYAAWAVGALETPFVAWASAALLAGGVEAMRAPRELAVPRGARRAAVAGAALVLLRADGFVLPVLVAVLVLVLTRRPRLLGPLLGAPLAALAAVTTFRLVYYGRALPNPVRAKVDLATSIARIAETTDQYVLPFLRLHGGWLLALAVLVWVALRSGDDGRALRLVAGSVLGLLAYVTAVGGDWMPLFRFLAPTVIPLVVLIVGAAAALGRRLGLSSGSMTIAVLVLGVAAGQALAGRAAFKLRRASPLWYLEPTLSPRALAAFWLPAVAWLDANVDPRATLVTSEAGFIPYLSGLRTVDSFGLADPVLAALPRGSVPRTSLGVHTRFTEAAPSDPAQVRIAGVDAAALVLQERMVRLWNQGAAPETLLGGRYARADRAALGGIWAVYVPTGAR